MGSEIENNKCTVVGNMAAMREALDKAHRVLHSAIIAGILKGDDAYDAINMATAALAAPARNCDVGTVDEQIERFHHQCFEYHTGRCSPHCRTLPAKTRQECAIKWAQMPYNEEGGDK